MSDYSKLTKKELLYTLLARDLMLEERRKENDLQKATVNTLIEDHKASQEWYKKQLAESESKVKVGEFWHSAYQGKQLDYDKVYAELRQSYDENNKLKQQLAQKDKQLEKLKSENHALISDNAYQEADMFEFNSRIEQLQKQLAEKEKLIEDYSAFFNQLFNQDKITFALEQLEKVKENLLYDKNFYFSNWKQEISEVFDNQIKQLKEME